LGFLALGPESAFCLVFCVGAVGSALGVLMRRDIGPTSACVGGALTGVLLVAIIILACLGYLIASEYGAEAGIAAPDLLVIVYMIGGTALAFVSAVLGWRVATRTPSAPPGESVPDRSTTQWWSH
jgi:hypothetical protein